MGPIADVVGWFGEPSHWRGPAGVPNRLLEHASLSGRALLAVLLVALPVGLVLGHTGRGGAFAVNVSNVGRAVPSLALLVLGVQALGIGDTPALLALVALGVPPVVTNTYVGMRGVDPEVRQAAVAMGMTGRQVLARVEAPLATPLVMAGVRTAAVQIVATATLAALVASGGLGRYIVDGIAQQDEVQLMAGGFLVALFAVLTETVLGLVQARATPDRRGAGMRSNRSWAAVAAFAALALLAAACGGSGEKSAEKAAQEAAEKKIVVGSTNFSEQLVLANMYAKMLEHHKYEVTLRPNLGTRDVVQPALERGEIDLVPEYVGTLLEYLKPGTATADVLASADELRRLLRPKHLTALKPAEAEDANALVVTEKTATEKKLSKISDLAGTAKEMVLGGPPECPTRPLCLLGFKNTYGLEFKEFKPLDAGGPITKEALEKGEVDVAVLFSSDGAIAARHFVVLEDDQHLQPAENIIPVIRVEKVTPELEKALTELSDKLTTEDLSELNKRVDVDKEDPAHVAEAWLKEKGLG